MGVTPPDECGTKHVKVVGMDEACASQVFPDI